MAIPYEPLKIKFKGVVVMYRNMKIRNKVVLGFFLVIAIASGAVIFVMNNIRRIDRDYTHLMNTNERVYIMLQLPTDIANLRRLITTIAFRTGQLEFLPGLEHEINLIHASYIEHLNDFRANVYADPELSTAVQDYYFGQMDELERLINYYISDIVIPTLAAALINDEDTVLSFGVAGVPVVAAMTNIYGTIIEQSMEYVRDTHGTLNSQAITARHIGIALSLFILLCAVSSSIAITLSLSRPINKIEKILKDVANGKINVNIDRTNIPKDEIGELTHDVITLVDVIKSIVHDLTNVKEEYNVQGNMNFRLDTGKYNNSFKEMIEGINFILDSEVDNIKNTVRALNQINDGNFNVQVDDLQGDFMIQPQAIRTVINNLNAINAEVNAMINAAAVKGDLNFQINADEYRGDWRKIMIGLNQVIAAINEPMQVLKLSLDQMKVGRFNLAELDKRLTARGLESDTNNYKGVFKEGMGAIEATMIEVSSYIEELEDVLAQVAGGNLTRTIEMDLVGDFDSIKRSVNSIIARLNETVVDISLVADGVSSGSFQLSQSSMDLSDGVSQQMLAMQEMADGISLIDDQAKGNSDNAKKAASLALTSKDNAEAGNDDMKHLLDAMERITISSNKISQIIKTIEGIAFQTNLLALNAAVEAARAGEQGRGFSVVAEEVRSLASRSAEAAKQTSDLIQESIENVQDGTKAASDTAASLDKIVQNVLDVSDVINEIFDSSTEQTGAIGGINNDLNHISQVVQSSAATSEETAAAAEELDSQVSILKEKLSFFSTSIAALSVKKVWDATTSGRINTASLRNAQGEYKNYASGEAIIKEGDVSAETLYFVLEGNVKVVKSHGTLNERLLAMLKPGDLFGEMALFLKEPRTAEVIAEGNVTVVEIHRNTLTQFMESNPDTAYIIIETLCQRLKNVLADLEVY